MKIDLDDLGRVDNVLMTDVRACLDALKIDADSQYWRRALVRSGMSYAEGTLFGFRVLAYSLHEQLITKIKWEKVPLDRLSIFREKFRPVLVPAELCILQEVQPQLDNAGGLKTPPMFFPLNKLLRFTFDVLSRVTNIDLIPDYSDNGWKLFQEAVEIRNRITHPRKSDALTISDEQIIAVQKGILWFTQGAQNAREKFIRILGEALLESYELQLT